jgi:hypothetical protein
MTVTSRPVQSSKYDMNRSKPAASSTWVGSERSERRQDLACPRHLLRDAKRNLTAETRSSWTRNDLSAYGITLTLVLLGTIAAAQTSYPVFWLLIGPGPLAVGFTVRAFLRQGFRRQRTFRSVRERNSHRSGQSDRLISDLRVHRGERGSTRIVPGF